MANKNREMNLLKQVSVICLLVCVAIGCASIHKGISADSKLKSDLIPVKLSSISLQSDPEDTVQLIEVTFENLSTAWLKFSDIRLDFEADNASKASVVVGQDLLDWARSAPVRSKAKSVSLKIQQLGLIAGGTIVALAGTGNKNEVLRTGGVTTALAGFLWAVGDALRFSDTPEGQQNPGPESYLYQPFAIPGKRFVRRWVLINKPLGHLIHQGTLHIETVEGDRGVYELQF